MESNRRILMSAGMIQSGKSGVGRYVIELVRNLRHEFPDLDLFVAGFASDRHLFSEIADDRWIEIPLSAAGGFKNLVWHQFKLGKILTRLNVSLVHIPSYRRMLYSSPIPQVATIHDCAPFILAKKYDPLRRFFGTKLVPAIARRCDEIIAVSQTTADDLFRYMKLSPEKVSTILNGLDHDTYQVFSAQQIEQFKRENELEHPFFLYVARIEHPGKNHIRLIEAFEALHQAGYTDHVLCLGGTDWHGADVVHERIAISPVKEHIRLLGFISDEALPRWYAAAQALVHPSLFEGFGLPIAEAMACGTLVLTSDRGSLKEVGGEAAIYFDPEKSDDIASAIIHVANSDPSEFETRIATALDWVKRYDWAENARECHAIYDRILSVPNYSSN